MDIKAKIKTLMLERGLSIQELSEKARLSQTCIYNWYNSKNCEPSVYALEKVCKALDIAMTQLFCNDDENIVTIDLGMQEIIAYWQRLNSIQRKDITKHLKSYLHNKDKD